MATKLTTAIDEVREFIENIRGELRPEDDQAFLEEVKADIEGELDALKDEQDEE